MALNTNTINANIDLTINCFTSNPVLSISGVSTTSPYTIEWSNGTVGNTCVAAVPGVYTVQITDNNGCIFTDSIQVEKYDPIEISFNIADVRCNGEMNGKVEVEVIGGYGPYTYSWNNGQTDPLIAHIFAGTYTVTVTDSMGCTAFGGAVVNQPAPLTAQIQTISNTLNLQVNGGTPGYTYSWNTGAITEDLNNINPGFFEVLITDQNQCMVSSNVIVQSPVSTPLGVEEIENGFNVYPNPATDVITINTNVMIDDVTFTNINGQNIKLKIENQKVDISTLPSGIYMVTVGNQIKKVTVI
jgi:hypothetical protein